MTQAVDMTEQVVAWSKSSDRSVGPAPAQGTFLGFKNRALETAYLQFEWERSRRATIIAIFGINIFGATFYWLDPLYMPAAALDAIQFVRSFVLVPVCALALLGAILIKQAQVFIAWTLLMNLLGGLGMSLMLWLADGAGYKQMAHGVWECMAMAYLLSVAPLRYATVVSLIYVAVFAFMSLRVTVLPEVFLEAFVSDVMLIYVLCLAASYRAENGSRRRFVALASSHIEWSRRLAAESDRNRWLRVIAAFLKHELNSKFAGLYTSLDSAKAARERDNIWKYHDRARRSATAMDYLLTQVADATNLESALVPREAMERIDLSALIADQAETFREAHRRDFALNIAPSVCVAGSAQALSLLLDKLFGNAIEHGAKEHAIHVDLTVDDGRCTLSVSDIGDPLPHDVEQLFEPFLSRKSRRAWGSNLGLGLYVARTIAVHHGGTVTAEPWPDASASGAVFRVCLPLAEADKPEGVTVPSGSPVDDRS